MNHNDNPIKVIKTEGVEKKKPILIGHIGHGKPSLGESIAHILMKQREKTIEVVVAEEKKLAIAFLEWIFKNRYQRYWGSDEPNNDKWYIQYTHANRNYFTTEQLFDIFIKQYQP